MPVMAIDSSLSGVLPEGSGFKRPA